MQNPANPAELLKLIAVGNQSQQKWLGEEKVLRRGNQKFSVGQLAGVLPTTAQLGTPQSQGQCLGLVCG